jgi:hypothetical protein
MRSPQATRNGTSNATFVFSTALYNSTGGELYCRRQGGHMAAWRSYDEQLEVEEWLVGLVGGGAAVPLPGPLLLPWCMAQEYPHSMK